MHKDNIFVCFVPLFRVAEIITMNFISLTYVERTRIMVGDITVTTAVYQQKLTE